MNNLDKLREILSANQTIAIAVGQNYGFDEIAAALGLYLVLKGAGKEVSVVSPKAPLVEVSNLVGIDKLKTSFDGQSGSDLTVSFPYRNDEIDKVSYTLESGFLNIVVKGRDGKLSFGEKDVIFKNLTMAPTVLFVIGTPKLSDLGSIINPQSLTNTKVINVDNKADNQGYGDVVIVSPTASSVCEQIGDFLLDLGLRMDIDASQNLFSGISYSTDDFSSSKTSPLAFEMAAVLMRNGAKRKKVEKIQMQEERPREEGLAESRTIDLTRERLREVGATSAPAGLPATNDDPPKEWLAPKIYKGSTNVG